MTWQTLWIGTYPPAGIGTPPGRGEGVYRVDLDPATGVLSDPRRVVETPAPSFVVRHPMSPVLYATGESEQGRVAAFRVDGDRLEPLGTASSGGAYPCHLLVDGDRLCAANYGDGALGFRHNPADEGGGLTGSDEGGRLAGVDECDRFAGADRGSFATSDEGRRFAYVTGELDATVHVLAWDPSTDTGVLVQTLPALGRGAPLDPVPHGRPLLPGRPVAIHGRCRRAADAPCEPQAAGADPAPLRDGRRLGRRRRAGARRRDGAGPRWRRRVVARGPVRRPA